MGFKLNLPKRSKPNPEMAAKEFCREIRRKMIWLEVATYNPDKCRYATTQTHSLRDKYHLARGEGFGGQLIQLADCVDRKVTEIVNFNPDDWNNFRRGQQFRRLDEWLVEIEIEWSRSRRAAEPRTNVAPFGV
jgi:hypothetical protein